MGLLDGSLGGLTSMSDGDQMMLGLAQGLLSARGGAGFAAGLGNMQGVQDSLLNRKLTNAKLQEAALQQQMQQYQLKRLQGWDAMVNGDPSGGAGPGAGPMGAAQPSQPAIDAQPGGGLGSGTYGMSVGGQSASAPQAAPTQQGWRLGMKGIPDNISRMAAGVMTPEKYIEMMLTKNGPLTDQDKYLASMNIDPRSPEGIAANRAGLDKANNIPPTRLGPNAYFEHGRGLVALPSPAAPGFVNMPDPTDPSGWKSVQIGGGPAAVQNSSAATAAGKASVKSSVSYDANNNPVYSTELLDAQRANGGPTGAMAPGLNPANHQISPQDQQSANAEALRMIQSELLKTPQMPADQRAGLQREAARLTASQSQPGFPTPSIPAAGALTPAPRFGAKEGADLSQKELSDKGASLMASNGQVNTVINRLQNIKMLAPGAITGAETGRRDFLNGLLSLAGIKGAEDAKGASDLLDKNASQIVTSLRMGQGGAGTDALQSLLGAGNPNRHMTKEAINEAVDQLIATQRMTQAKAQMLQPHYLGRDPVAYGQKEMTFDQHADPRIWQLEAMQPQQQAAYVKSLPPEVAADMLAKRKQLKAIGAIK